MAFSEDNSLPLISIASPLTLTGFSTIALCGLLISRLLARQRAHSIEQHEHANANANASPGRLQAFLLFVYCCFLKPQGDRSTQQGFLESFYQKQAAVYDTTRDRLLQGRTEMLALAAAQLKARPKSERVWIDVGGGTGWCIEAMAAFVDVPEFFSTVFLVDLSPSLCEVARQRVRRLGWTNVQVVCEDARTFCPPQKADLITMSYSLSMIPDYYPVIDSLVHLLAVDGVIGVVDFYTQSGREFGARNYTGSHAGRHVNWFLRSFWRAWFELDHISVDAARRDYLEFKFGTVLTVNARNRGLGWIPYYIWLGRSDSRESMQSIDQTLSPEDSEPEVQNRAAKLPLPAAFYQNQPWRAHYHDQLPKHTQFHDEYIYAFTWEDARQDHTLLSLRADDVVLAITSAGDNILSYATKSPASIHAVDLNPAQNHLLELKLACYTALPYEDFWLLFGEGKHPNFRHLLLNHLSPHLSSRAFQYWHERVHIFERHNSRGLYDTGGSRHALRVLRWTARLLRCRTAIRQFVAAASLPEQVHTWEALLRPALLSPLLCKLVVSQESFLWNALGVPKNQLAMIEADHRATSASRGRSGRSQAVWRYMVDTLDPVAQQTHIAEDNPYYYVCLAGQFSQTCHPEYLSAKSHALLSQPGALDNLHLHTDEIAEVLTRIEPASLTVAVLMDSMDWFDPGAGAESATAQVVRLNGAMKMGGRVLLRSAALRPWYLATFTTRGFTVECVGLRMEGICIDRVNMYASCWICTKVEDVSAVDN